MAAVAPIRNENLRECGIGPATGAGGDISTGTGVAFGCTRNLRVRDSALFVAEAQPAADMRGFRMNVVHQIGAPSRVHRANVSAAICNHKMLRFPNG